MTKPRNDKCFKLTARGSSSAELFLYGVIGEDLFTEGVTAKAMAAELKALGKLKQLDVRINSEGGSVFDGKAIYALLNEHPAHVVVHVDGLAASAASFIAMAGDEIVMAESAFMMIHRPFGASFGTAEEHRQMADVLDEVNASMVEVYAARTGLDKEKIEQMLAAETWMAGPEAVELGFADRVVTNKMKVAACVSDPSRFRNLPRELRPNRVAALKIISR